MCNRLLMASIKGLLMCLKQHFLLMALLMYPKPSQIKMRSKSTKQATLMYKSLTVSCWMSMSSPKLMSSSCVSLNVCRTSSCRVTSSFCFWIAAFNLIRLSVFLILVCLAFNSFALCTHRHHTRHTTNDNTYTYNERNTAQDLKKEAKAQVSTSRRDEIEIEKFRRNANSFLISLSWGFLYVLICHLKKLSIAKPQFWNQVWLVSCFVVITKKKAQTK